MLERLGGCQSSGRLCGRVFDESRAVREELEILSQMEALGKVLIVGCLPDVGVDAGAGGDLLRSSSSLRAEKWRERAEQLETIASSCVSWRRTAHIEVRMCC